MLAKSLAPLLLCGMILSAHSLAAAETDDACAEDAQTSIRLMHHAYPGAPAKLASDWATPIGAAEENLRHAVKQPLTAEQCDAALLAYLAAWKDVHICMETARAPGKKLLTVGSEDTSSMAPSPLWIELYPGVVVLRLPSFEQQQEEHIVKLAARLRHAAPIDTLLIDLRGNRGGSDFSFEALELELRERAYHLPGADAPVTRETIEAYEFLREAGKGVLSTKQQKAISVAIDMMRGHEGEWIGYSPDRDFQGPPANRTKRAAHVAVLVDKACMSSCEDFLLSLRLGTSALLIGGYSAGGVDYTNIAPFMLPSKERAIVLPVNRSRRLPKEPIDGVGIPPDIPLDWGTCSDTCHWVLALRALREHFASGKTSQPR